MGTSGRASGIPATLRWLWVCELWVQLLTLLHPAQPKESESALYLTLLQVHLWGRLCDTFIYICMYVYTYTHSFLLRAEFFVRVWEKPVCDNYLVL